MSVELVQVSKSFGGAQVLAPMSLSIRTGELLALLGPSGCGKTTTLRLIAGLERPDAGRVLVGGTDLTAEPPERRGLGMVFQSYAVWPHRSVAQNVGYPLERSGAGRAEILDRVREALALVHLDALAERRPHQLSGGQLQRVALARALVARPRVLLLDEPLSNLDALLREEMRAEIRALQRRLSITTVLVTHDQAEALAIADRVAVLDRGRIEQLGEPQEIYDRPATRFVAEFVGGGNVIAAENGVGALVVRPEEVVLDPDGREMRLTEKLYRGDRVEARLDWNGVALRAVWPVADAAGASIGGTVRCSFRRTREVP